MDTSPSPPPPLPTPAPLPVVTAAPPPAVAPRAARQQYNPEENTITNICTSNIILDLPQVTTRSRTGAIKPQPPPVATPPNPPIVTKIITKQTGLQAIGVTAAASSPRQPPPLQQMHSTPPPPRLQQMVHAQAPPPLQAKPRGTATAPPPLQIKVVPASRQSDSNTSIIVTAGGETPVSSNIKVKVELGHPPHVTGEEAAEEGVSSPHQRRRHSLAVSRATRFGCDATLCLFCRSDGSRSERRTRRRRDLCRHAKHLHTSRLHQPGGGEQRLGHGVLQQRVCGHALQVCPCPQLAGSREAVCEPRTCFHFVSSHLKSVFSLLCRDVFMAWCAIRAQNSTTVT